MEAALEQVNLRLTQHCENNEEPASRHPTCTKSQGAGSSECQAYLMLSYHSKQSKLGSFIHIFLRAQQSQDVVQVFLPLLGIHLFPDGLIKSMSPGEPGKVTLC